MGRGDDAQGTAGQRSMQAYVVVRVSTGERVSLYEGDVIGRVDSAALVIDDPRVSVGHAMISLRKGALWLLALRRMLRVEAEVVSEVELKPDLRIELADGLTLTIEEVHAPSEIIAIESKALGRRMLAPVSSIVCGPPPRLVARYLAEADAHLWTTGTTGEPASTWRLRIGSQPDRAIGLGDRFAVGGCEYVLRALALDGAEKCVTDPDGGVRSPIHITAAYDSVELAPQGRQPLRLTGVAARLLSELVIFRAPVQWEVLAREVWTGEIDSMQLRHRLDSALHRLRRRLRDAGISRDFVATDGGGQVWLTLTDKDTVDDRT